MRLQLAQRHLGFGALVLGQISILDLHCLSQYPILVLARIGHLLGALCIAAQHIAHAAMLLYLGQGIVKQADLKRALFEQPLDLRLSDGSDVVKPALTQGLNLGALNHAAIAHEGHILSAETRRHLLHLRDEGLRILCVALEHLDAKRRALGIAQQPDHDLALAAFAIAVIAEGGQLIVFAFQIATGDIVQEQPAVVLTRMLIE
ncbi:MAG: hypothetical protein MZW92_39080 [Comamonadaceae bacterium]|nr:hypothetical protein [Comamonadaceae bacterium]